ncbi:hypothetical protein K523DRAFT_272962 [Schizophyllum commune Tattone D]|nr:hypothetical protein K523DRAFT_272962 [Schizophyllum commune Tattone D]
MLSSMYQPSPYYPLQATYHHPIQPLTPRDKYLAAVAEAEAARASYIADEAARREEEALHRRLDELRARRQRFSAPAPIDPRDRRLFELRREVEEEERRQRELALAAEEERREQERVRVRWEMEEQALREERRRQIVEGGSRSFEYPRFQARHPHQSPFRPQPYPHHQHVAHQSQPAVVEFVIDEPHQAPTPDLRHTIEVDIQELLGQLSGLGNVQAQEPPQRSAQPTACAPPSTLAKARAEAWKAAAAARSAPAPSAKACPFANTACSPSNKACLTTNKPCHPSSKSSESSSSPTGPTAPQLDPTVLADLAGQFLGTKVDSAQVKSAMDMFSAFVPQASAAQASARTAPGWAQPAQASAPAAGPAEFGGLEGLLSTLFGGAQATAQPQASSSKASAVASSSKPAAPAPTSAQPAAPTAHPAASSTQATNAFDPLAPLRAQLASRLNTEEEAEIRDTMHAIMLSLQDQEEKFKAGSAGAGGGAAGSSGSSPGNKVDTNNKPDITVDTTQAKGKGRASPEPPRTPTSQDIAASLNMVRNIDAAFSALAGDFAWPSGLDFTPVSSREASPVRSSGDAASPSSTSAEDDTASVTSSTSSPLSKLAYTARNQPVRFYEQSLSALLSQLDAVESWGSEEVRRVRREVVGRVGRALEEVEGEVEGRWGVWVRREIRAEKVERGREVPASITEETKANADAVKVDAKAKEADAVKVEVEAAPEPESQAPSVAESVVTIRPAPAPQASEESTETVDAPVPAYDDKEDSPTVDTTATSDASPTSTDVKGYEVESSDGAAQGANSPADPEDATAPSDADVPTSPSSMSSPSVDTFLLPAEPEEAPTEKVAHAEGTDSDWSEVEA